MDLTVMANKHEELLSELEFKMRQLMNLCDLLKQENETLKAQLEESNNETIRMNAELEELNSKFDSLKIANALTGTDTESVEMTKKRISKLVHDIEKCISLLKI